MATEDDHNNNNHHTAQAQVESHDPIRQLGAIKEIIFGPEMKELTDTLESLRQQQIADKSTLEGQLDELKAEFKKDLSALSKVLDQSLHETRETLQAQIHELSESKTDRQQLGKMLVKLGENLMKE